MQFNSYIFILLYLPIFVIGYFLLNRINSLMGKIFIIIVSMIFYIYGGLNIAVILGISIVLNFILVMIIKKIKAKKIILGLAVTTNIVLLLYYKYFNFAIITINEHFMKEYSTKDIVLPLGISFFTFQQIMYLVSIYKEDICKVDLIDCRGKSSSLI